jgi:cytochrome c biogenesis protein
VYLFADRYSWAALATFASHLSLILFMAGGIISKLVGFETFISVGEGMTQPVFPVVRPNQMQVLNLDSVEGKDAQGRIIDYHTDLVVYRHGEELCRGSTSVNGPLNCAGYRFHQASFAPDGVKLRVREVATGALVYNEAPILSREPAAPSPRVVVKDATGALLFDGFLVLAPLDDRRSLEWVPLGPNTRPLLATAYRSADDQPWRLSLVHLRDRSKPEDQDFQVTLAEGQSEVIGGLQISFPEIKGIPALVAQGIPGIAPVAFLQLVYEQDGSAWLDVQNLAGRDTATSRLALRPGEPVVAGEYEYTFEGVREYTGILVKRDPGSWFIWVATALLIGGLAVTFYVPRRRLWLKVTPERTYAAGIAERTAHLSDELQRLLDSVKGMRPRMNSDEGR